MVALWARTAASRANHILASELTSQLSRSTHVGTVSVTWTGTVALHDIRVADRTDPRRLLFRARSVAARLAPWRAVWASDSFVSTISRINLDRPELHLTRDRLGHWNIEDLLKAQAKAPPSPFRGVVTASHAVVVLRDETGRLTGNRSAVTLSEVAASADLRRAGRARYSAVGVALQPRPARFALSANDGPRRDELTVAARARNIDAALLSHMARPHRVSAVAGTIDTDVTFAVRHRKVVPRSLRGYVRLTGARLRLAGVPVHPIPAEGLITASNGQASVQAEARVEDCPVRLSGRVALSARPMADLTLAAPSISPVVASRIAAAIRRDVDLKLRSPASAQVHITGALNLPSADIRLDIPEITSFGVRAQDVRASARLDGRRLLVQELAASLGGGVVNGSGWLALPPPRPADRTQPPLKHLSFAFAGSFREVDLSAVHPRLSRYAAGRASGNFAARSDTRGREFQATAYVPQGRISWAGFTGGRGRIRSTDGRVWQAVATANQVRALRSTLTNASGQLQLGRDGIRVRYAAADGWAGRVLASGMVRSDGRLALQLAARDVSAGSFLHSVGFQEQCSGSASFQGQLSGTIARPKLDGQMRVVGAMWRGALLDRAVGRVSLSQGRLAFRSVEMVRDGSTATLEADIRFVPKQPAWVNVNASTDEMPLSLAARLLGSEAEPPGSLAGHLHAEGPVDSITVRGEISASDLPLPTGTASAAARFQHTPSGTQIESATLTGEGMAFSGDGTVTPQRILNIRLHSDAVDLAALNKVLPRQMHLEGTAAADVSLTGALESPDISAYASSAHLSVNDAIPASARASLHWSNGLVTVQDGVLRLGDGGSVVLRGQYAPVDKWLSAGLWARYVDVSTLTAVLERAFSGEPPAWIRAVLQPTAPAIGGRVDAEIAVAGPVSRLAGTGTIAVANPIIGTQVFHELAGSVAWDSNEVRILDCALSGPGLLVAGDAVFPNRARPTVVVSAPDASVQALVRTADSVRQFLPSDLASVVSRSLRSLPQPASGWVTAGASLAGIGERVDGTASFTAEPLILRGERLNHVDGSFAVRDNKVLVRRLSAEGDQLRATVTGSAGFAGEMDLDIEASNVNLAALAPILGLSGPVSGLADISAKASGTIERPTLRASASTSSLAVGDFRTRLVSAPGIVVEGDTLTLGDVAVAGDTFQATLTGTLPFSWSPLEVPDDKPIDLSVSLGKQDLSVLTEISPEITQAQGYVTGALQIGGTLKHPTVKGSGEAAVDFLAFSRARNGLKNVRAVVQFDERTAQLQSLEAQSDLGGSITGRGWVALTDMPRPDFRVELDASGLQLWLANASGTYGEVFRGAVNGTVVLSRRQGQPPHLEGELTATSGSLTLPTQPPKTSLKPVAALPKIALGAAEGQQPFLVRVGRGFQLVRGGLRASLTDDIRLSGFLSEPDVAGTLTFENGTVRFATQRFRIVPGGTVTIAYSPSRGARATLDVSAQTTAFARVGPNGERERYTIIVDLSGPIDNPRATFSSDPPGLSRRQILAVVGRQAELEAILRGEDTDRILREQLGQAFAGALVPEITSPIEHAVAEALGLEEFAILYDLGAETQVQVTKHLVGRLFLTYRRTVAAARQDFLWKLAYRIQRRLQLSFSVDERRVRTFAVEGRVHF